MQKLSKRFFIPKNAFSLVELLVIIVVIAILTVVTVVISSSVAKQAAASSLKADLTTVITKLKDFRLNNGSYPLSVTDCPNPASTNLCINLSSGNSYVGYAANNSTNPPSFLIIAMNSRAVYKATDSKSPSELSVTTQSGVTPGASVELHAAKANGGNGPGINSPITTTWADTSGNSKNSTLQNFSGSPWSGAGTTSNPYNLTLSSTTQKISVPSFTIVGSKNFTYESWFKTSDASATNRILIGEDAAGGAPLITLMLASGGQPTLFWWGPGWSADAAIFGLNGGAKNDGAWHHAIATADGTRIRLYVDNVEQSDGNGSYNLASASATGTTQTTVGAYGSGAYFPGSIAVTRIYPFGLTAAQVAANYNAGPKW
jgi:type II secretory pathway pseudopilin PulG